MNFSGVVKEALAQKKMKNVELARLTGYSPQYMSDLISGERRWNEEIIDKVCVALNIDIKYEVAEEPEKCLGQGSVYNV
ncbi:helix-turn-helix domain-containing protein [Cytobacillus oceanisediminis]|uniref:helix-turn-helix domain-containing protein n=1 Tax=Cytobacillus oceanisediminis TaxID=665099 RepID=UPI00207AFB3B|nr:helix-turn-helix transcriptional regulator [Cytobacillus oceanisediminis]USK46312.1 helix-turn-helix transcriptional regulator [Cytobacillus oceanisediminis]